ncbi:hypothetical protein NQ318_017420 [Aromia moschata]|uniref:Uncharacterized protein n=1 Tax=Aromia moschata TaxID=1265417 RepID=A0AAV8Z509_9CUCU|nr:hypothetical protein NQ318_017420 [Aromia moschata]
MKPHKVEQREKWIKAVRIRNADGSLWQPNKYTKIVVNISSAMPNRSTQRCTESRADIQIGTVVARGYPALYTPIEGSRIYQKPLAREVEPPRILVAFLGVLRQHRLSAALVSRRQNRQGRTGPAFVTILIRVFLKF